MYVCMYIYFPNFDSYDNEDGEFEHSVYLEISIVSISTIAHPWRDGYSTSTKFLWNVGGKSRSLSL